MEEKDTQTREWKFFSPLTFSPFVSKSSLHLMIFWWESEQMISFSRFLYRLSKNTLFTAISSPFNSAYDDEWWCNNNILTLPVD